MARAKGIAPELMRDSKLKQEPVVGRDQYDGGPISVRDKRTGEDKLLMALLANRRDRDGQP